ncbi:MAG: hypothetical protein FGM32_04220 [Candidatus Kapabacteria bacterium]|nr:hypothetical protein [Candidatus Kapabacteria bacterium]
MLHGPGTYEWWYTDALDSSGEWGVVMILFRGMPMSPDYLANPSDLQGGYALSIYHRGVRIAFAFGGHPLDRCCFAGDDVHVSMPGAELRLTDEVLKMTIDAPCGNDGRRARVAVTMNVGSCRAHAPDIIDDPHAWILAAPRSRATVNIQIHEAHGEVVTRDLCAIAYHDHNMGARAMAVDFRDWYWGRLHTEHQTLVYLVTKRSADETSWFGRVLDDGNVEEFSEVSITLQRPRLSMMGLRYHQRIILSGRDSKGNLVSAECLNARVCEDGPFYQRYISRWRIDGAEAGLGMSEYMDVSRLSKAWIRPFLRLPWVVSS